MSVRLITGDCREELPKLDEGSADCCITDPPYGETSLKWDRVCSGWIQPMARVLKPNGSLWVFGSMRFLAPMFADLEAHGFKYAQDIVWEKHNGTGLLNDRFRRVHEHAIQFYRGLWRDIYKAPQFTMDAIARTVRKKGRPAHWIGPTGETVYRSEDGGPKLMRSVMHVRSEHGHAVHPTQKPLDLLRPLVRYSCPPLGTVLDCFAGSGSTGIAAKIEGCNAVLIEIDTKCAAHRLANDSPLFAEVA